MGELINIINNNLVVGSLWEYYNDPVKFTVDVDMKRTLHDKVD